MKNNKSSFCNGCNIEFEKDEDKVISRGFFYHMECFKNKNKIQEPEDQKQEDPKEEVQQLYMNPLKRKFPFEINISFKRKPNNIEIEPFPIVYNEFYLVLIQWGNKSYNYNFDESTILSN